MIEAEFSALPAHPSTPVPEETGGLEHIGTIAAKVFEQLAQPPAYVLRGLGLFEMYREELEYLGASKWLVPSGTKPDLKYEVRVGIRRESRCECIGFAHHKHCTHVVDATIARRKSAVCDSCGKRHWWSEITEVFEDDGLLDWYPGDRLCRVCIRFGAWA